MEERRLLCVTWGGGLLLLTGALLLYRWSRLSSRVRGDSDESELIESFCLWEWWWEEEEEEDGFDGDMVCLLPHSLCTPKQLRSRPRGSRDRVGLGCDWASSEWGRWCAARRGEHWEDVYGMIDPRAAVGGRGRRDGRWGALGALGALGFTGVAQFVTFPIDISPPTK